MSAVFDEFQRELAALRQACAGNPERELIQLFLLALEREELVSISYRESLMQQRIAAMPLPEDVKELLRHALVWIWKDEEMHTIYIRGAILKLGSTKLKVKSAGPAVSGRRRDRRLGGIGHAAQPMEPGTVFAADCDNRDRDWRAGGQGAEECQAAFATGAVSGLLSLLISMPKKRRLSAGIASPNWRNRRQHWTSNCRGTSDASLKMKIATAECLRFWRAH